MPIPSPLLSICPHALSHCPEQKAALMPLETPTARADRQRRQMRGAAAGVAAFLVSTASAGIPQAQCEGEATFTVTFEPAWIEGVTQAPVPTNAHWSPMVVVTHASPGDVFAVGGEASPGIRSIAETGATVTAKSELDVLFDSDVVRAYRTGSRLDAVGASSVTLSAAPDRALLTMISMVAPSPDWFVGVEGVALCDGAQWVAGLELPLLAQDAGTDSGTAFAAPNLPTQPQQAIAYLDTALERTLRAADAAVFGTLRVKRN